MAANNRWPQYLQPVPTHATTNGFEQGKTPWLPTFYDGNGGGSVDPETKNYLDAKVDAVKAQNDARFAEVLGKLDGLAVRLDAMPRPVGFWQLAGLIVSAMALGLTMLALFADRFDGGLAASAIKDQIATEQDARNTQQDEKLNQIIDALGKIQHSAPLEP